MLNGSQKLRFDESKYLPLKFNQPKLLKLLYQLTVSESNRLNTPVIFAWLSKKSISKQQNGQKHEQDEAEQQNAGAGSCRGVLCALLSNVLLFPSNRSFLSYKNSHFQKKAKCETFLG